MGVAQLVQNVKPRNVFTEHPGKVGSVGEVRVRPRFRQSCAEMPWAFDPYWTGKRPTKLGSNVQDGYSKGYNSGGGPASTTEKGWNGNRSFKHQYGYTVHDIRPLDTSRTPIDSPLPKFGWKSKVARTRYIKAGSQFMPMGYTATGTPRGGLYPTSTKYGGTTPASTKYDPTTAPMVDVGDNAPKPTNNLQAGPTRMGVQRLTDMMQNMRGN